MMEYYKTWIFVSLQVLKQEQCKCLKKDLQKKLTAASVLYIRRL